MSLIVLLALVLLTAILAFKILVLLQAFVWLWRKGERYANMVFALGDLDKQDPQDIGRIMVASGGDMFPLGVYPLPFWEKAILPNRTGRRAATVWAERVLRAGVSIWLVVPCAAVVLTVAATEYTQDEYAYLSRTLGYGCAVLLLALMLVSAIGTFVGNVVFGELNLLQVGLPGRYRSVTQAAQGQMAAFMGSALFSWIAAAAAVTYTSARIGGFERFPLLQVGDAGAGATRFIEAAYFVALAALGVTEIDATTAATKVLIFLTLLLGLSLIAFLLGLLVGVVGDASRVGPPVRPAVEAVQDQNPENDPNSCTGEVRHVDGDDHCAGRDFDRRATTLAAAMVTSALVSSFVQMLMRRLLDSRRTHE